MNRKSLTTIQISFRLTRFQKDLICVWCCIQMVIYKKNASLLKKKWKKINVKTKFKKLEKLEKKSCAKSVKLKLITGSIFQESLMKINIINIIIQYINISINILKYYHSAVLSWPKHIYIYMCIYIYIQQRIVYFWLTFFT